MGRGKAFGSNRFFHHLRKYVRFPASPVTINPDTGRPYGPEFPHTTIRDDVRRTDGICLFDWLKDMDDRIHKHLFDQVMIGGSMRGISVLEWPLCTLKRVTPLATSAHHSNWCISWGASEAEHLQ